MPDDFEELLGQVGDLMVRAVVTDRGSDETRKPYVEIEDLANGDRLMLPWGKAALLGDFLGGQGMGNEEGFDVGDDLSVAVSDDLSAITFVARDPRQGRISISRAYIGAISDLLRRAADSVSLMRISTPAKSPQLLRKPRTSARP